MTDKVLFLMMRQRFEHFSQNGGSYYDTQAKLSEMLGESESTIKRSIKKLSKAGFIKYELIKRKGVKKAVYSWFAETLISAEPVLIGAAVKEDGSSIAESAGLAKEWVGERVLSSPVEGLGVSMALSSEVPDLNQLDDTPPPEFCADFPISLEALQLTNGCDDPDDFVELDSDWYGRQVL